jgi:hypothetical protein
MTKTGGQLNEGTYSLSAFLPMARRGCVVKFLQTQKKESLNHCIIEKLGLTLYFKVLRKSNIGYAARRLEAYVASP